MNYKDNEFMNLIEELAEDIANPVNDLDQLLETNKMPCKKAKKVKEWHEKLQTIREEINNWVDEIED